MWWSTVGVIVTLTLSSLVAPLAVEAQQARVPTIGVLVREAPGSERFWQLFRQALSELGYIEGQNIRFEFRSDQGQISRLPELAAELVRRKVDIIVPWFTPAATAAKQATREISIVCAVCGDPVGTGLVESLARPGGNVTGIAGVVAELSSKSVELLHEMVPSARRSPMRPTRSRNPFSNRSSSLEKLPAWRSIRS